MEEGCLYCNCFKENCNIKQKPLIRDLAECKDHLHNWERWLKERKGITNSLSKRLKITKDRLLMNIIEDSRKHEERKILLANKINWPYYTNDNFRGNPKWFEVPPRLYQHSKDEPIYQVILKKEEKKEAIPIVYIETPTHILKEKDILTRTRTLLARWQKKSYRKAVFQRIDKKLKFLEPHKPNLSNIVVIGTQITCKELSEEAPKTRTDLYKKIDKIIKIEDDEKFLSIGENIFVSKSDINADVIPKAGLFVNGTNISSASLKQDKMTVTTLFTLDQIPKEQVKKCIVFENKGSTTLRISFQKYNNNIRIFRDIIPFVRKASPFYFNKNELILLPFHQIRLPIWFKTSKTGHFIETWEIIISPKLWTCSFKLTAAFRAIVYDEENLMKSESIKQMLSSRVRQTLMSDTIMEILRFVSSEDRESYTYTYSYTAKELFESVNMEKWGTLKHYKYVYDKDIFNQLIKLYYTVKSDKDPPHWDYSIKTLREMARKKDIMDFVNNLHKKCTITNKRAEILKEILDYPNPKKIIGTKNVGSIEIEATDNNNNNNNNNNNENNDHKSTDHKIAYGNNQELDILLQKIRGSTMLPNENRTKYAVVFFIWRFYLMKISNQLDNCNLDFVDVLTEVNYTETNGNEILPERLIFERSDDMWVKRKRKVVPIIKTTAKPKQIEEYERITLQSIKSDVSQSKRTGRKCKFSMSQSIHNVTPKKLPSTKIRSRAKFVEDSQAFTQIIQGFDPYGLIQTPVFPALRRESMKFNSPTNSIKSLLKLTYKEKYIIVYTNLCAAVDAMVNTLETMTEAKISVPTLNELIVCKVNPETTHEIPETTSLVKPSKEYIDTSAEYYQYLVNRYLKNPKTEEFFIEGKMIPIEEKIKEYQRNERLSIRSSSQLVPQDVPLFSRVSHAARPLAYQEELEKEVQIETEITNHQPLKPIPNILIRDGISVNQSVDDKDDEIIYQEEQEEEERELFYILDSSDFIQELETSTESNSSSVSQ